MKGQTPAITAVLITTVIVGSVATAYVWGTPILEKRESQTELQQVENQVLNLQSTIVEVSRSGEGTTERVKLEGEDLEIMADAEKDVIEIETESQTSQYPLDTWSLIKGKSIQNLSFGTGKYGVKGSELPGIVAVRPAGNPGSTIIRYRIEFRNLLTDTPTGERLQKIDLTTQGKSRAVNGATLLITNQGTELDSGSNSIKLSTGRKIERKRTVIEIDFR